MTEKIKAAFHITGNRRINFGEVAYCGYILDGEWYDTGVRGDLTVVEEVKLQYGDKIIKDILSNEQEHPNDTVAVYKFRCKISMSSVVLDRHEHEAIEYQLASLHRQLIFLHDIDFTVDLKGVFNQGPLRDFLVKQGIHILPTM